jgi:hypothetical protein
MDKALRQKTPVKPEGVIKIRSPELLVGTAVEVIVLIITGLFSAGEE